MSDRESGDEQPQRPSKSNRLYRSIHLNFCRLLTILIGFDQRPGLRFANSAKFIFLCKFQDGARDPLGLHNLFCI